MMRYEAHNQSFERANAQDFKDFKVTLFRGNSQIAGLVPTFHTHFCFMTQ